MQSSLTRQLPQGQEQQEQQHPRQQQIPTKRTASLLPVSSIQLLLAASEGLSATRALSTGVLESNQTRFILPCNAASRKYSSQLRSLSSLRAAGQSANFKTSHITNRESPELRKGRSLNLPPSLVNSRRGPAELQRDATR